MKQLSQKHGETEFLADLIKQEMGTPDHPDAVIFAGPKIMLDEGLSEDSIKPFAADVDYPVFYMNYVLNPIAVPWKDSISRAINGRGPIIQPTRKPGKAIFEKLRSRTASPVSSRRFKVGSGWSTVASLGWLSSAAVAGPPSPE